MKDGIVRLRKPENGYGTFNGWRGLKYFDVPPGKDPFGTEGKDMLLDATVATRTIHIGSGPIHTRHQN